MSDLDFRLFKGPDETITIDNKIIFTNAVELGGDVEVKGEMDFVGDVGYGTLMEGVTHATGYRILSVASDPATAPIFQFGMSGKPVQVKVQGRPNDLSTLEVRGRTTKAAALTGMGLDAEIEIRPETSATAGYARGAMGVARIASGKTLAGTFYATGLYGQWRADGTVNGDVFATAIYGIIEDGGTYTAVNHLAALWLDSRLAQTVTSGKKSFISLTNNGGIEFDNAIYIYGGTASQGIANLFNFDTCTDSGMVEASDTTADYTFTNTRKIKILIDGVAYYLIADKP